MKRDTTLEAATYIVKYYPAPGEKPKIWDGYHTEAEAKEAIAEISDTRPEIEFVDLLVIYARDLEEK